MAIKKTAIEAFSIDRFSGEKPRTYRIWIKDSGSSKFLPDIMKDFYSGEQLSQYLERRSQKSPGTAFKPEFYVPPVEIRDTVWCTKNWLKCGITQENVLHVYRLTDDVRLCSKGNVGCFYRIGKDIFKTKEEAIAQVKKEHSKKLLSLRKQMNVLESTLTQYAQEQSTRLASLRRQIADLETIALIFE